MQIGFTRIRDLLAVALIAAVVGYLLVRLNYGRIPTLPRLAGLPAVVVGGAEAIFGWGLRARINAPRDEHGLPTKPPVPPLVAARAMMTAKATALAGSALAGLWAGLLIFVAPRTDVAAATRDTGTALIGILCSVTMIGGALYLEWCCRAPDDRSTGPKANAP